jgi:peptide chain release factor 2
VLVTGENAYGFCKAERGVHRLVRISPFDSNKRRHTSFASVDAIAEIEEETADLTIPPERSCWSIRSGRAARAAKCEQGRNRPCASRICPTGLVAASQAQRSQAQNKATAMRMLLSKLFAQRVDQQKAELERFYGEKGSVSWGNRFAATFFNLPDGEGFAPPGVETSNVQAGDGRGP